MAKRHKLIYIIANILLASQLLRMHSSVIFEMTVLIGNKQIDSTCISMNKDELLWLDILYIALYADGAEVQNTVQKNSKYFARQRCSQVPLLTSVIFEIIFVTHI